MSIEEYLAGERSKYESVMKQSTRGQSVYHLISMAIEHGGSGSRVAASLILALEHGTPFKLQELVLLDPVNRAHADLVIASCKPSDFTPSEWLNEEGYDGKSLLDKLQGK